MVQIQWRKANRFVIARALCARGNLAVPGRIVGKLSAKSQAVAGDSYVASLLGVTRQAGAAVHQCPPEVESPCTGRSLSAATDAIGAYRFHGGLYGTAVPSRDCHGRKAPSQ